VFAFVVIVSSTNPDDAESFSGLRRVDVYGSGFFALLSNLCNFAASSCRTTKKAPTSRLFID